MQYIPSGCTQANDIIPPDMTFMGTNYRTEAGGNFYLKQDDSAVQSINTVLSEQKIDQNAFHYHTLFRRPYCKTNGKRNDCYME